jgi:ABC-type bacteriocin/lantibiotic exporter with double-glycine peptidase domain
MFLLDPLLIRWLIDRVLPARNVRLLLFTAAGFFAACICRLLFSSLASLMSFRTAQQLVFRIRLNILRQMNRLSADYHDTRFRTSSDLALGANKQPGDHFLAGSGTFWPDRGPHLN